MAKLMMTVTYDPWVGEIVNVNITQGFRQNAPLLRAKLLGSLVYQLNKEAGAARRQHERIKEGQLHGREEG